MNIQLDPPPVPALSPSQRARLRNRVMDQSVPVRRPSRRWAAPVIAVAAVGAIVAGTLAISNQGPEALPGPPRVAASAGTTSSSAPAAEKIDRGPASKAEADAAAKSCRLPGATRSEVLWSRRVAIPDRARLRQGVAVLVKNTPGQPGDVYGLGLMVCFAGGAGSAIHDSAWTKQPTRTQGLISLGGSGSIGHPGGNRPAIAQFQSLYRVRPEIARIQSRYVWDKGTGQWLEGVVTDGFAYTASGATIPNYKESADGTDANGGHEELRAFDSLGNPVPIQY
jgi:hypothetical protein